jgi:hypothetical protein
MSGSFQLGRGSMPPPRSESLQRSLAAPVLAAAIVALCGLVARGPFLLESPLPALLGLFLAVAIGASLAGGLFASRPLPFLHVAIAFASSGTAGLLLFKLSDLRAGPAASGAPALPVLIVILFLPAAFALGLLAASAGARLRALMTRHLR